jgi:signal transduction histidine kinase/ABC-type phosphate/phosphonate transport system substrate-binding protein
MDYSQCRGIGSSALLASTFWKKDKKRMIKKVLRRNNRLRQLIHGVLLLGLFLFVLMPWPGSTVIAAADKGAEKTIDRLSEPKRLEIAVVAKRGKEKSVRKWQPTADYLTRHIPGYKFVVVPYSWDEIRQAVAMGVGDFVLTNPGMYVEFEALHDVRRIATLKNLRLGKPYTAFGVVFFKRKDRTDITTIESVKGKRLVAVNETAWGGWQVGWRQLLDMGLDPYKDLNELVFAGSHDKAVLAVRDKKVDIGAVRTDTLERMAAEGTIDLEEFTPLFLNNGYGESFPFWLSTGLYPEWPFATASHTAMELNEKVAIALMSIPADSKAARTGRYEGWTVPSNYQPIHETLRMLKVTPYEHYGEITLGKVLGKYWKELILALILIIGLCCASFYFRQLNRRLNKTQNLLHDELSERVKAQKELQRASEEVGEKNLELEENLEQIHTMQDQIIMQEKMASLGSLTAGIAHEIKNPLNFVINFSELTVDLVEEINEELEDHRDKFDDDTWSYLREILGDLSSNATKINEHGKRSDSIVRNMLNHSKGNTGERVQTQMNTFVEEYIKLGYHGMRANDSNFNVTINTDYDPDLGSLEINPQDMSRVILNIVNNACYAVQERQTAEGEGFEPTLWIQTKKQGNDMELRIKDNGTGMPDKVKEKVFNPFFTTKPTGSGTGLGLSMSYDIVVQGHKGRFEVESKEGEYTCFILWLPGS